MSDTKPTEESGSVSGFDSYYTNTLALRELRDYTSFLSGKIKTIVDASIEDPQRRKAIKDLVHNAIWNEAYTRAMNWANFQDPSKGLASAFPFSHPTVDLPGDSVSL